jgi:hypothetical protein
MKMVEYRVVSCIGQIIIDTDTALFLIGNFQSGLFPALGAIVVVQVQSKNPDYLKWMYFYPHFNLLPDARIPRYMLNHG